MIALNPELQRNLWLELSLHRLIAAPVILGLILALSWSSLAEDPLDFVATADTIFLLLVVLWGTRRAAAAVVDEIEGRTWDGQRLSALGAWTMTWGKLIGCTAFVWYCALLALVAAGFGLSRVVPLHQVLDYLLISIGFAFFVQAAAFLASLALLRRAGRTTRGLVTVSQLFGIGLGLLFMPLLGDHGFSDPDLFLDAATSLSLWYGLALDRVFALVTLFVLLGWLLLGCYRLMRLELQYAARPWAWLAYLVFVVAYGAGFAPSPDLGGPAKLWNIMFLPVLLLVLLHYLGLFTEPRSWSRQRALFDALAGGHLARVWRVVPLWLLSYLALAIAVVLFYWLAPSVDPASLELGADIRAEALEDTLLGFTRGLSGAGFLSALLLFLLRDALLVLLLSVGEVGRRADLAALVYLVCLYVLSGALLEVLDLPGLLPLFYPTMVDSLLLAVGPAALQVLVLAVLIRWRWRVRVTEARGG